MFYDAVETSDMANEFTVDVPISAHRRTSSGISNTDSQVIDYYYVITNRMDQ